MSLYYYTSIKTLFEIISNHTFRLYRSDTMNDSEEFFGYANEIIDKINKINFEQQEQLARKVEIIEKYKNAKIDNELLQPFIMSFTNKKDNFLMWFVYAENATGVCIEFDETEISKIKLTDLFNIKYKYNKSEHFELIKSYIESGVFKHPMGLENSIGSMILNGERYKKEAFVDESETRLQVECLNMRHYEKYFECTRDLIREYVTIKLEDDIFYNMIKSITLGKFCKQSITTLKKFLEKNKMSITIKESSINTAQTGL